jgi:hypothetical protein
MQDWRPVCLRYKKAGEKSPAFSLAGCVTPRVIVCEVWNSGLASTELADAAHFAPGCGCAGGAAGFG